VSETASVSIADDDHRAETPVGKSSADDAIFVVSHRGKSPISLLSSLETGLLGCERGIRGWRLVFEVTLSGEDHWDGVPVARLDDFVVLL
jgi:hypothetical protein